jgi:hypothetical protein
MKRAPKPTKRERQAERLAHEGEPITAKLGQREVPVPFVASWSSEMPDFRVRPEPLIQGKPAIFRGGGRRGEGTPIFGKMDPGRQRLCVLRGLCQVCSKPIVGTPWMALFLEDADLDGETISVVREPAACTECMAVALQLCPGLRRKRPRVVEPGQTTTLITLTIPPVGGFGPLVEGGPELEAPRIEDAVVGYLKLRIHTVRQHFTPDEFLRRFT